MEVNEANFGLIAKQLLQKASQTKDPVLKEKALFGSCYFYLNPTPWYESVWSEENSRFEIVYRPQSDQFKALLALEQFEKANGNHPSAVVSNCDVYTTFIKRNK